MKTLLIHWLDATCGAAWTDLDGFEPDKGLTVSIGFLIFQDKDVVVLAGTWDETTQSFNNYIVIPQGMIRRSSIVKG